MDIRSSISRTFSPWRSSARMQSESKVMTADDLRYELELCMQQLLPSMLKQAFTQECGPVLEDIHNIVKTLESRPVNKKLGAPPRRFKSPRFQSPALPLLPPEVPERCVVHSSCRPPQFFAQSHSQREVFTPLAQEEVLPGVLPTQGYLQWLPTQGYLQWLPTRQALDTFMRGRLYEHIFAVVTLAYSAFLGWETQYFAVNHTSKDTLWLASVARFFCVVFTFDILLRAAVQRANFFLREPLWNLFDFVTLGLQLVVQVLLHMPPGPVCTSMLHWLQPLRVIRLVRVVANFENLRTIALAIASSMRSLGWTLLILCITLYACSITFTQLAAASEQDEFWQERELHLWFGDLFRTALTLMESILGGVSWDEAIRPLISDVGPFAGVVYCLYVVFSVIAVLNMVTGVYVQDATQMANDDFRIRLAKKISDLFHQGSASDNITWETFQAKLSDPDMQEYFKDIDVEPSEAHTLFMLLDVDHSGEIDTVEIVDGLIRLHGNAKALDMRIFLYELLMACDQLKTQQTCLASATTDIDANLAQLKQELQSIKKNISHQEGWQSDHTPRSEEEVGSNGFSSLFGDGDRSIHSSYAFGDTAFSRQSSLQSFSFSSEEPLPGSSPASAVRPKRRTIRMKTAQRVKGLPNGLE